MSDAKSPIKDKPLRLPGQSLEEQRDALFSGELEPYLLTAVMFVVYALLDWYRYFIRWPSPWVTTCVALAAIALGAWKFHKIRPRMRALRQGADGEKAVGQFLERLREQGYVVFHDLLGPGFNVDHALIGPGGIFTVETKTWSKPAGNPRIVFDGETLAVGTLKPDRDPLIQARAQAGWLKQLLAESTGKVLPVEPVILFPGWFVEERSRGLKRMWVLEPKMLPGFLANTPARMDPADVKLAAFHLSRFVRTVEKEREAESVR